MFLCEGFSITKLNLLLTFSYLWPYFTAWKFSVFRVILFRILSHLDWVLRYSVSLRIQSECGKMRTRISLHKDTFYAVFITMSLTSWITTLRTLQRKYLVVILFIYLLIYFFCETWQSFDFAKVSASTFSAKDKTTIRFC